MINNCRYKDAITLLRRRLTESPIPKLLGVLSQAESTYRYMLQYYAKGVADPGRNEVLAGIRSDLLAIADMLDREQSAADSSELYYSTLRMCRLRPGDIGEVLRSLKEMKAMLQLAESAGVYPEKEQREVEELEGRLFDALWTADSIPASTYREVFNAVAGGYLPASSAAVAIAAVGLGAMNYYNREAIIMLCDAASAPDPSVAARGMAHLIFVLDRWRDRIKDDTRLKQRLDAMMDMDGMSHRFETAVMTAIRTRDTNRVSRKMERDVIPGLMQLGPDILRRLKDVSRESSLADLEANPEWEEILEKTGLEDKLRDLSEMQSDGADVMMVAFSNMKGYPFFRQLRNWLLPFSMTHSAFSTVGSAEREAIGAALELNFMMCDSDKYSFAYAMTIMPEAQRRMVTGQMRGQMEQVEEQMKEITGFANNNDFDSLILNYMRDLYRLHRLHPKRGEMLDPYAGHIEFTSLPVVGSLLGDSSEFIKNAAEFYFRRRYYAEAFPLYSRLSNMTPDFPHLWEKVGFCIEKSKESGDASELSAKAIEAYMKARLFNPDSRWISRRLGMCYRKAGDLRNAAECIMQAMPENEYDHTLTLMLADILAEEEKWDEALKTLYRADYERPGDAEVLRRMAKSALMCGKSDKAEEWMASISSIDLNENDYLLKGHIALSRGDIAGAIERYRKTIRPNDDKRLWKSRILADAGMLGKLGVVRDDLLLLMEAIAYEVE